MEYVCLSGYAFRHLLSYGVETWYRGRCWVHEVHGALFVFVRYVKGHLGVKWGQIQTESPMRTKVGTWGKVRVLKILVSISRSSEVIQRSNP